VQAERASQRIRFKPILWSSCLAMFAIGANSTAIMAALPSIRIELSLRPGGVEWAVNSYLVASAAFIVLGARRQTGLARGWHRWLDWRCSALRPASLLRPAQKLCC
jgi:hypothetical protein